MMDYGTTLKLIRFVRIADNAETRLKRASDNGDRPRARRSARLITAAHSKINAIVMGSVRPYSDL
jgi:hypothetical protein